MDCSTPISPAAGKTATHAEEGIRKQATSVNKLMSSEEDTPKEAIQRYVDPDDSKERHEKGGTHKTYNDRPHGNEYGEDTARANAVPAVDEGKELRHSMRRVEQGPVCECLLSTRDMSNAAPASRRTSVVVHEFLGNRGDL